MSCRPSLDCYTYVLQALIGLLHGLMRGGRDLWLTVDSGCVFSIIGCLSVLLAANCVVCTGPAASPLLCHRSPLSVGLVATLLTGGSLCCTVVLVTCSRNVLRETRKQVMIYLHYLSYDVNVFIRIQLCANIKRSMTTLCK